MNVDLEELAAIIEQLDKTEFTDFRYENGSLKIQVRRGGHFTDATAEPTAYAFQPAAAPAPAPTPAPTPPSAGAGANGFDPDNLPEGYVAVSAPMLGSFYASPKPGEPSFVNVGDAVGPDSVVCIVEVMKLMNSVTAGAAGEVAAVFAANGDLVEFVQPLYALKVNA